MNVEVTSQEELYNGQPQGVKPENIQVTDQEKNPVSDPKVEITYQDKDGNSVSGEPKDAGEYTVIVEVKTEDNTPAAPITPNAPEENIADPDVPLTNLPENQAPAADAEEDLEEVIELEDPEVPLANLPEEPAEEIPDEAVPFANTPKTGDTTGAWALLMLVSGVSLAWLGLSRKENTAK